MKISQKAQLAILFLAIACFIGVVTSLIINSLITNQIIFEAQERVKEDLNTARWVYNSRIKDIDRIIHWMSTRHIIKNSLRNKKVSAIQEEFSKIMVQEGLDFLIIVDWKGIVILRFNNPEASGDNLIEDIFVKSALKGKGISGTQIVPGDKLAKEGKEVIKKAIITSIPTPKGKVTEKIEETSGMVLKAAYPIIDYNGEILGALIGGKLLNRDYEIVDQIKEIVFKDAKYKGKEIGTATIFLGDLRIATNVMDKEGHRAIGTRAMKEVQEQVLLKGKPWIQRAFVVDDWYITAYEPILDVEGKIVGMLYVGIMEAKYRELKEKLILLFFLFSMSGMLLALTISFLLSWKIQKRDLK